MELLRFCLFFISSFFHQLYVPFSIDYGLRAWVSEIIHHVPLCVGEERRAEERRGEGPERKKAEREEGRIQRAILRGEKSKGAGCKDEGREGEVGGK